MMTRRDYVKLAAAVLAARKRPRSGVNAVVDELLITLHADNDRFNAVRFLVACGYNEGAAMRWAKARGLLKEVR